MADKKIDPRVYIPLVAGYDYEDIDFASEAVGVAPGDAEVVTDIGLLPPENVYVVEQIFRKGPDGKTLVDLVLEVEDVPAAVEYEVRTAKV